MSKFAHDIEGRRIKIIPSIDLLNGKVVRLLKGDYNEVTEYSDSYKDVLDSFFERFIRLIHIVNLDGARGVHNPVTERIIRDILSIDYRCKFQIGGGIRSFETAARYIKLGARVVLGTICVTDPETTQAIIEEFGAENVVLAFDCVEVRPFGNYRVKINGWQEGENIKLEDMLEKYYKYSGISILCTDISVDGTLTAPNFELYKLIKRKFPKYFLEASGGVSCIEDIEHLQMLRVNGVIVGKALYSGMIPLRYL